MYPKNTLFGVLTFTDSYLNFVKGLKEFFALLKKNNVEFKNEEFIDREMEIAGYLLSGLSLYKIEQRTGLGKKILQAHLKNMMRKLKVENMKSLIEILKQN